MSTLAMVLFVLSWLVSYLPGGASVIPPHAFYIPIVVLGARFGWRGAAGGALAAGLLAGPLLPADVATGEAQLVSDWISRGLFFLVIGSGTTVMVRGALDQIESELELKQREVELRRAISDGELVLWYQPIIEISTRRLVGAEALVRWNHPTEGMMGPDTFIPLAESCGAIHSLGEWVLTRAIGDVRIWDAAGSARLPGLDKIAVNVSRRQFTAERRLIACFDGLVTEATPLPVPIEFEVTETALADDAVLLIDQLGELRLRGGSSSIDDFGTGYSTVLALRLLPIDVLKVDRAFIDGLVDNLNDQIIVRSSAELARRMGLAVVAEGIETEEQLDALRRLGIEYGQGYLIARPMPFDDFCEWASRYSGLDAATSDGVVIDIAEVEHALDRSARPAPSADVVSSDPEPA